MHEDIIFWVTTAVGLGCSLITLFIKKMIDIFQEKNRFKRELFKLVFERKTNAVENAMGWYQEALDVYRLLQMSCNAYREDIENFALNRLFIACQQADKLFREASIRLNPIYLYYDFSDVEQKYRTNGSSKSINESINKIATIVGKIQSYKLNDEQTKDLRTELKELLQSLSESFNAQISTIIEIQIILRNEYKIQQ